MPEFSNKSPFEDQTDPSAPPPPRFSIVEVIVVLAILALLAGLLMPATQGTGPSSPPTNRVKCDNHLRAIVQGLQAYHELHDTFPPAFTVDAHGKPLHSWRTLLLPYIDESLRYSQIDLSKPWDDPANAAMANEVAPHLYRCPNLRGSKTHTSYLAVVSPRSCLRGGKSVSLRDIKDPQWLTMLILDAPQDCAVHWMSPEDARESTLMSLSVRDLLHDHGFSAAMTDGSVRFISAGVNDETLKALSTVDGNDRVDGTSIN